MRYTKTHRDIVLTAVASVILITASYAVFGWSDPDGAPPESSLPIPLDTGSADQTKIGALKVKSLATDALYVNNVQKDTVWDAKEPEISNGTDLQYFRGDKTWQTLNTTTVPEGTNLYFTDARAQAALQTQLNDKAPLADPKFTGNVTMPGTGIWDISGKVGIGKTNPGYLLDVNGVLNATDIYKNGAPFLVGNSQWNTVGNDINYTGGKVGIGTATPGSKLHITNAGTTGNIRFDTTTDAAIKDGRIIQNQYASGTETEGYASIYNYSDSTTNRVNIGGGINDHNATNQIGFWTATNTTTRTGTERVRINSSGNVGIGTTSLSGKFNVQGTTGLSNYSGIFRLLGGTKNPGIFLSHDETSGQNRIAFSGTTGYWGTIAVATTDVMSFLSSGKVGIGTTTPASLLHVFGGSGISQQNDTGKARSVIADGKFYPNRDGSPYYYLSSDILSIGWSSGAKITTAQGGGGKLTIDPDGTADVIIQPTGGNVGIGTTSPQSALHIPDGKYLQAEDNNAGAPPSADCDSDTERGRISLDTTQFRLYICAGAARRWDYAALSD